ncbi:MAG TPA: tetratricopeptide repeat protein, partial [Syntrophorhabdaceae bacterium]
WQNSSFSVAQATAEAADYIAPEIDRQLKFLPLEVLFLRGMAARARKDTEGQLKYFRIVWEKGRPGKIFGIAAHFFGLLVKDKGIAERALRDSIKFTGPEHQAQVYHSLGNLLSKDRKRWEEAELAYGTSIELDRFPESQAETYHSLGNLLSKNRKRWEEAEKAYVMSLELSTRPEDQAQVYHSLGNLLSKDKERWEEAELAYDTSLELRTEGKYKGQVLASWANLLSKFNDSKAEDLAVKKALDSLRLDPGNPWTNGVCYRILAEIYEKRHEINNAIDYYELLLKTDIKLRKWAFVERIEFKIAQLRKLL